MGLNGPFFIQCKHFYCVFNGTRSTPKLTISILNAIDTTRRTTKKKRCVCSKLWLSIAIHFSVQVILVHKLYAVQTQFCNPFFLQQIKVYIRCWKQIDFRPTSWCSCKEGIQLPKGWARGRAVRPSTRQERRGQRWQSTTTEREH